MISRRSPRALGLLMTLGSSLALAQSPQGTWHGDRDGVRFFPSGENLAYDRPAPTVHPDLTEHSRKMVPGVYQVAESVYLAYGYALTSPAMIVGSEGVIIVDPPEDVDKGRRTLEEFRKFSDKPVKAVIYSHWHIDHYAGVAAFASLEDAASGDVMIIAHKNFLGNMIKNSTGGTGPIIAARVDYSLGTLLEVGPEGRVNGGLGPDFVIENPSLIAPNVLVDDVLDGVAIRRQSLCHFVVSRDRTAMRCYRVFGGVLAQDIDALEPQLQIAIPRTPDGMQVRKGLAL